MDKQYILGIDTSNYKTSIAVTDGQQNVICDIRRFLTVKQGEKGLRQSDALFQHMKNLPEMVEELVESFQGVFAAIACSSRPRPVEGSYMPVFLAGESFARSLAAALHIPALRFSHQEGHIEAIRAFSALKDSPQLLACHFSGGTSELLKVTAKEQGYGIERVGGSKDIAFGQVIDRAGVALGMAFPAGEEMDEIALCARSGKKKLTPVKVQDAWLNLSGIDTQMKRMLEQMEEMEAGISAASTAQRNELIRELFERLSDAMGKMILQGAEKTGLRDVLLAGGVASSRFIRERLSVQLKDGGVHAVFDERGLSQDNAVGTALLGGKQIWR